MQPGPTSNGYRPSGNATQVHGPSNGLHNPSEAGTLAAISAFVCNIRVIQSNASRHFVSDALCMKWRLPKFAACVVMCMPPFPVPSACACWHFRKSFTSEHAPYVAICLALPSMCLCQSVVCTAYCIRPCKQMRVQCPAVPYRSGKVSNGLARCQPDRE